VGNINVGGTGKSPLVGWLAQQLSRVGSKPGIVSRGYGGRAADYPCEVTGQSDPMIAGDEAVMLARKTGCPVVVDPNRPAAVRRLLAIYGCDVVISDDGLQHYALGRDVEIAVVDARNGLGNGLCLPAGPLREPASRLLEVDIVVVNGPENPRLNCQSMEMKLVPKLLVNLATDQPVEDEFSQNTIHGIAGIGNPDRFFDSLRASGFKVIEHKFEDHHRFELTDLDFGDYLPVVMTEKDATKCRLLNPSVIHDNFWYLTVDVEISDEFLPAVMKKAGIVNVV